MMLYLRSGLAFVALLIAADACAQAADRDVVTAVLDHFAGLLFYV